MVSQKEIKGLDFNTIEEYFEYILDSKLNGQRPQAQKLYKKLSSKQKSDFQDYTFIEIGITYNRYLTILEYLND